MSWPSIENDPFNEYQVSHLATMAFPTLFPDGEGAVETEDDIVLEDDTPAAAGPPTDNPSEDVVYDDSTEMSSFLPVGF